MANKYWIGGSGNFSDPTKWTTPTSGGANNTTKPTSGDVMIVDGHASGLNGGTLTIDEAITVQSITWGAAFGTIDNSGNHLITCSVSFSGAGTAARTWIGGTNEIRCTIASAATAFTMSAATNLTNPTTAFANNTIVFSGNNTNGYVSMAGAGLTYGTVSCTSATTTPKAGVTISGANTIGTLAIGEGQSAHIFQSTTINAITGTGTVNNPIGLLTFTSNGAPVTVTSSSGGTIAYAVLKGITLAGAGTLTANNSLDLGANSGSNLDINVPSIGAGGGSFVIGG